MGYTSYVETGFEFEDAVNGLVDSQRAAALLGVPLNTFKVWASRSKKATTGIPAQMPEPIATMHGSIYRLEDIEKFGQLIAHGSRTPRSPQRTLGAYYTPDEASELMARWALRTPEDTILEPSVGSGQFALAVQQLTQSKNWKDVKLHACELDPETAAEVVNRGLVNPNCLHVGDFLNADHLPQVDAVIGNPPFVRLRDLDPQLRRHALRAASVTIGQEMDNAGSAWMPFVSKATCHLQDGGRLALVLPLDFTYVRYARPLWEFLGKSFGSLRILRFQERVFKDILQNVLILLADEKGGSTSSVHVHAHKRIMDMPNESLGASIEVALDRIVSGQRVFQEALLPTATREALSALNSHISPARDRVKFNIGYVSGNKSYFHPATSTIEHFGLPDNNLIPTIASSRQLSKAPLKTSDMTPKEHLWLPKEDDLTKGEVSYIEKGEDDGVDMAYKCRIRKPWYRVPSVRIPDVVLTTFSERPRLHINDAGWAVSNSALGGRLRPGESSCNLINSWYNPITLLSAELQIHSLGGGVMIAVPKEADSIRILNTEHTKPLNPDSLDSALRSNDPSEAYNVGEETVIALIGKQGLDAIKDGAETLRSWRKAQHKN